MFSRLQNSNENIKLDDKLLSDTQFQNRKYANEAASKHKLVDKSLATTDEVGIGMHSLVFLKHDVAKDKSKVRDLYIVTDVQDDAKIAIQKVMHPFTGSKREINNKNKYRVKLGDVYLAPCQSKNFDSREINCFKDIHENNLNEENRKEDLKANTFVIHGNPRSLTKKPIKFYTLPSEHDEENDDISILADMPNDKEVKEPANDVVEQIGAVIKPAKTYERHRLNTFPKISSKRVTARILNRNRENVHQRWLTFKAKPPDNIDQVSKSSPTVEPLSYADQEFGAIRSAQVSRDPEEGHDEVEINLANTANQVALSAINESDDVFEDNDLNTEHLTPNANRLDLIEDCVQAGRVIGLKINFQVKGICLVTRCNQDGCTG